MKFLKPKIIISKCLEFDACRYDGQIINNQYIAKLKDFIDFKEKDIIEAYLSEKVERKI